MATLNAKLDTDAAGASAAEETSLARSGKNASGAVTIKSEDGKSAASPSSHSSEKNNSPVPHLVLPTKALMSHLSNNEPSKVVAASAGNGAGSRPTVPPLVFPLANIFEERTPLPVPGHTGAPLYANPESATYLPLSSGSSAQQWDPNDNAPYVEMLFLLHPIHFGRYEDQANQGGVLFLAARNRTGYCHSASPPWIVTSKRAHNLRVIKAFRGIEESLERRARSASEENRRHTRTHKGENPTLFDGAAIYAPLLETPIQW